jgi:outer membrane protein OmpA-like peptidoglycan-associated protein
VAGRTIEVSDDTSGIEVGGSGTFMVRPERMYVERELTDPDRWQVEAGFVQVAKVGGQKVGVVGAASPAPAADAPAAAAPNPPAGLASGLETGLPQVLDDLVFPSGSASLAEGDYASLAALAAWLAADTGRKVVLVGHTDASGGLEGNIKLSRLRAESVRQFMLFKYDLSPDRIQAEGIGFLSPRESNLTEQGRQKNRRVEVMATSTELSAP